MPNVSSYLQGFDLKKGQIIGGYELVAKHIDHKTVNRYREYEYPSCLIFQPQQEDSKRKQFEIALMRHLAGTRVIHSGYENPYECKFGVLHLQEEGSSIVVTATGHATRITN
jgi:hypothetical protein